MPVPNPYTLIANSGIHLLPFKFTIDFNDSQKILFYETEDLVDNKCYLQLAFQLPQSHKVYYLNDMVRSNFMNMDHTTLNPINSEEFINGARLEEIETNDGDISGHPELFYMQANSSKYSMIEKLYNQWLPVPFYELDDSMTLDQGPYNWCRIKIIPIGAKKDNKQEVQMLMAFDTHALYPYWDNDSQQWENVKSSVEFPECPMFESEDNNANKNFQFCYQLDKFFDFAIGNKGWVRDYLRKIVHPEAPSVDEIKVNRNKNERKYAFLASYIWLLAYIQKKVTDLPVVELIPDRGQESVPVEMVIDIGNSRTAAVLFELNNTLTAKNDFSQVELLKLQNFLRPLNADGSLNRTQESFDMRIAFQPVSFNSEMYRGSGQFVWPSMVRLGQEAQLLTNYTINLAEGNEGYCTYSSPKRYLWDSKMYSHEWRCVMKSDDGKHHVPSIMGISNFFNDDGSIDPEGFGTAGVHYSRKTLMTLAFMEILSQAKAQINGHEYRYHHDKKNTGRYLDKVILTCPTGMSKIEQKALHNCLQDAIVVLDNFYQAHDQSYVPRKIQIVPDLNAKNQAQAQWIFDEATCSQFVYLYGLFRETYRNCSQEFFNIYGKKRDGKNSIVIGSLDIGAGTSDVTICKYEYNQQIPTRLKPVPLFWDSFNFAGDDMLHALIYNILIQGEHGIIEQELRKRGISDFDIHSRIFKFFGRDNTNQYYADRVLRRDFNLQVLVPIMYEYLRLLSNGEASRTLHFEDFFKDTEPSQPVMKRFADTFGFDLKEIAWEYNPEILSARIASSMDELLKITAHFMAAYDCDIVILSGRPTSLEAIKETFMQYRPVNSNRLIMLNKHHIGDWYPFADPSKHCINNSKSIVPMGAMLGYLAANFGGFENFSIDLSELGSRLTPTTENFVVLDDRKDNICFITPERNEGEVIVSSNPVSVHIGSKQYDLSLYPIRPFYELSLDMDAIREKIKRRNSTVTLSESDLQLLTDRYTQQLFAHSPLTVTIKRDDYIGNKEHIRIETVVDENNTELSKGDFKLSIQSLNDPNGYWLDTGAFDTNISK